MSKLNNIPKRTAVKVGEKTMDSVVLVGVGVDSVKVTTVKAGKAVANRVRKTSRKVENKVTTGYGNAKVRRSTKKQQKAAK